MRAALRRNFVQFYGDPHRFRRALGVIPRQISGKGRPNETSSVPSMSASDAENSDPSIASDPTFLALFLHLTLLLAQLCRLQSSH